MKAKPTLGPHRRGRNFSDDELYEVDSQHGLLQNALDEAEALTTAAVALSDIRRLSKMGSRHLHHLILCTVEAVGKARALCRDVRAALNGDESAAGDEP